MLKVILIAAFAATVPAANWMIQNVGDCSHGPCLIPVGFGLMAPSGVLLVGMALVLRDMIHQIAGWKWAVAAIAIGAAISWLISPAALVIASVSAFALSEFADLAVYAPLRRRGLALAVAASGVVGAAVDSAVFLLIAFGSLDFIAGQIVGKMWMTGAAVAALTARRALLTQEGR